MIRLYRLGLVAAFLIPVLVAANPPSNNETDQTAEVAAITRVSDSAYAAFKKAVATSDVNLLLSFFVDTAGVVMPDMNSLQGLEKIRKRAPILMRIVGGGKMEITRTSMRLREDGTIARDAGDFTVTRQLEDGSTWRFDGNHTLFWKKSGDGVWKLDRAFIGEDTRPRKKPAEK